MLAMRLHRLVSLDEEEHPLAAEDIPVPVPQPSEMLIQVAVCGVCHTELDEIEGRTAPSRLPITLGHQVVGRVASVPPGLTRFREGDRVGVGWIHHSTGAVDENLSLEFRATGRDVDGGYAEFLTVPESYAYPIPEGFSDAEAAPLLCAGAIGYRALRLTQICDGQPLGLTGFGGSAHLVLQLSRHLFPNSPVFVFARDPETRDFAVRLGAAWAGETADRAPEPLQAIIDTTPAWRPVVEALANLRPGGRLVINAIRKTETDKSSLSRLDYSRHLWMEKEIKSVANITGADIREFLPIAAEIPIRPVVTLYSLREANRALRDLHRGAVKGAKVLEVSRK